MPIKNRIKPVGKKGSGVKVGAGTGDFTNAQDLENRFWNNSVNRRKAGDKARGDAGYWNGGRCQWGGSHNLKEDCESLANFFNSIADLDNDVQEIKLSMDENEFNDRKHKLLNKLQDCINKCQASSAYSVANICCIWNDYFGTFLKKFLDKFQQKLQSHLKDVQNTEAKHQREILELEAELRTAETKYNDAMTQAAQETDPVKRAQFLATAQASENEVKKAKAKLAQNPLSRLSQYSYLNDLGKLIDGNLGDNTLPTQLSPANLPNSNNIPAGSSSNNGNQPPLNPFSGNEVNASNQSGNQQLLILAVLGIAIVFLIFNKEKEETY